MSAINTQNKDVEEVINDIKDSAAGDVVEEVENINNIDSQDLNNLENNLEDTDSEIQDNEVSAEISGGVSSQEYQQKIDKLEDDLMRTMADMQNLRARTQKEVADASKFAVSKFALDMINVLENLQRAQENTPQDDTKDNKELATLLKGVSLTEDELSSALKKHGIEAIDEVGVKFDHNLHQAVVQIPDDKNESGTVVQLMQAGYMIKDRLLRPAMVGVAKAMPNTSSSEENESQND